MNIAILDGQRWREGYMNVGITEEALREVTPPDIRHATMDSHWEEECPEGMLPPQRGLRIEGRDAESGQRHRLCIPHGVEGQGEGTREPVECVNVRVIIGERLEDTDACHGDGFGRITALLRGFAGVCCGSVLHVREGEAARPADILRRAGIGSNGIEMWVWVP